MGSAILGAVLVVGRPAVRGGRGAATAAGSGGGVTPRAFRFVTADLRDAKALLEELA